MTADQILLQFLNQSFSDQLLEHDALLWQKFFDKASEDYLKQVEAGNIPRV